MIAAVALLAVLAGAGWGLVLALVVGRACALRDAGGPNVVDVAPGRLLVDGREVEPARPTGVVTLPAGEYTVDQALAFAEQVLAFAELELETRLPRRRWWQR